MKLLYHIFNDLTLFPLKLVYYFYTITLSGNIVRFKRKRFMKTQKDKEVKPVPKLVIKVLAEAIVEQMLYEASMGVKHNQTYIRAR